MRGKEKQLKHNDSYLITTVSNGNEDFKEIHRRTVGQIKLELREDFTLQVPQIILRVAVIHQVTEPGDLEERIFKITLKQF